MLITGPVGRDEHWQRVDREADLKANAQLEPLTYHGATITAGTRKIDLNFNLQAQNVLESLHFSDGATLKEISYGKGRVFWAAIPWNWRASGQALSLLVCGGARGTRSFL